MPRLHKACQVAGERGRVAAHIGNGTRWLFAKLVHNLFGKACPRRVYHYDIGIGVWKLASRIAAHGVNVIKSRALKVSPKVAHGGTIGLYGRHKGGCSCQR